MNYELYRRSTLGITLTDALDDLIQSNQLNPQLAMRILGQFDKSMAECLGKYVRNRASFKGRLHTYRFCDEVWTFVIDNCNFRIDEETIHANRIKIVACNAKKIDEN